MAAGNLSYFPAYDLFNRDNLGFEWCNANLVEKFSCTNSHSEVSIINA